MNVDQWFGETTGHSPTGSYMSQLVLAENGQPTEDSRICSPISLLSMAFYKENLNSTTICQEELYTVGSLSDNRDVLSISLPP